MLSEAMVNTDTVAEAYCNMKWMFVFAIYRKAVSNFLCEIGVDTFYTRQRVRAESEAGNGAAKTCRHC